MKKALAVVAGVAVLGVVLFASLRTTGEDADGVYAETVERREIVRVVKASGEIDPRVKVKISAHVIGRIERLDVEEGDEIEAGDPFLQLEQQAFVANRDQWAAQLASARTEVRKTEADVADTEIKLRRAERLTAEGIITQEALESAQLAVTSAQIRREQAQEAVQQARANLVKAEDDLAKTVIDSPLTGRVIELNAEKGEVVVSGTMNNPASVIGTIADLSELLAVVDVDETEIVEVAVGQPAEVQVDAVPDHAYHGRVVEVGSSGFSTARQPDVTYFKVKVLLEDADERLRTGMSARAEIQTAVHDDVPVVPIQSVVDRPREEEGAEAVGDDEDGDEKVVFVVADGIARRRPVETGIADETHVEVTAGLDGEEQVVTGPYRVLRDLSDGDAVAVEEPGDEDDEAEAAE